MSTGRAGDAVRQRARDEVGNRHEENRVQKAVPEVDPRAVHVLKQVGEDHGETERNQDPFQGLAEVRGAVAASAHQANQIRRTSATVVADAVDDAEQDGKRRLDEEAQGAPPTDHIDDVLPHAVEAMSAGVAV